MQVMLEPIPKFKHEPYSLDTLTDITRIVNEFYDGNRIFHENDLRYITDQIEGLFLYYRSIKQSWIEHVEIDKTKFFIRILQYGVLFKFVVMMKLSDGSIHKIYYE